jgi:hypothetical protein
MRTLKDLSRSYHRTFLRGPLPQRCPIQVRAESRLLLAVRVEDTVAFLNPAVEFTVGSKPWRSPEEVPAGVLAYGLTNTPGGHSAGGVPLTPHHGEDDALLLARPQGKGLICLILGRDAKDGLMGKPDLSAPQRRKLQEFLVRFDRSSTADKGEEEGDPEFARATQEISQALPCPRCPL